MLQECDRNTPTRVVDALLKTHYNVKCSNLSLVYESHATLCKSASHDLASRCTDTSDIRHFGPKTFRHYVFGTKVSHIFALVPKCNRHFGMKCPLDTSAAVPTAKCLRQFGTEVHETLQTQN